jgi:hypothetical protein
MLKAYRRVSTGDLKGVYDRLLNFWPDQHLKIQNQTAQEQNKITHQLNKPYFHMVQGLVYNQGLHLILIKCIKLHKAKDQFGANLLLCVCITEASMGIPCYHTVAKRLANPGYILPEDIHPFWWYKRPELSTNSAVKVQTRRVVLNPVVVRGKGRPRGARGRNAKNNGITTTRRDPSQFEYIPSLSAPARLNDPEGQPARLSTTISTLILSSQTIDLLEDVEDEDEFLDINNFIDPQLQALTTTQLCVQRLQGISDTYRPGTLPPRLYQSNPFAVQTEVTETGRNEYRLTAKEMPATIEEVRKITENEEDKEILSQIINLIRAKELHSPVLRRKELHSPKTSKKNSIVRQDKKFS